MNKTFFIYVGLALSILFLIGSSNAQDKSNEDSEFDYGFGRVVFFSENSVVITIYNEDSGSFNEVEYVLDPDTEYEHIKSIKDIKIDDYIEVYFKDFSDSFLALKVVRDPYVNENIDQEVIPLETNDGKNESELDKDNLFE